MTPIESHVPGFALQPQQIQMIDSALPTALYAELQRCASRIGWQFGWNTPTNPHSRYWHHEVGFGAKANRADVSDRVRSHPEPAVVMYLDWLKSHLVAEDARVLRYYFNAHTYGTDGWPHTDADRPGELTAVLYLNGPWKPEWCGETVVFNARGDIAASVLPAANRLLTFPADRLHAPRPLSKSFEGLRVVLVAKLAPGDAGAGLGRSPLSAQEQAMLGVLEQAGCLAQQHSGRSLQQHLWGTYRLLVRRGAEPDVCHAGLFHSIHGTNIYQRDPQTTRQSVRDCIGVRAERLAWLFCQLQRPQCWLQDVVTLSDATPDCAPSAKEMEALRLLELANLDEQGDLTPTRRMGLSADSHAGTTTNV